MKEQQKRNKAMKDFDEAWDEIRARNNQQRTERENFITKCRWRESQSIQEFQKQQMADKLERSMKIFEEINDEQKQISKMCKEDYEREQEELRESYKARKNIGDAISVKILFSYLDTKTISFISLQHQMRQNYEARKQQLEQELKMDQIINEKIRVELERAQNAEKKDREHFRREVFGYLDHLMVTREHNQNVEKEKEKLIEDIRARESEESWKRRCEAKQKRELVNQIARIGQVDQIKRHEKQMIEEMNKEKHEIAAFNEREALERKKIREGLWQQRLKAYHYGCELMEQRKAEELRDLAEKQKLNETLMLAAQERDRCETMGREFVKSYQDVLPLHPNLLIIQKGKKN